MFGMGGSEIIVILIVALLFLGPDKLPNAAKTISKGIRDIKKQSRSLQQQIESDEQIGGAIRDLKSALRGEDEPRSIQPPPPRPYGASANTIHKPETDPEAGGDKAAESAESSAESADHGRAALPPPAEKSWIDGQTSSEPAPEPVPAITLPKTAGEAGGPEPSSEEASELAAMIKPASGTVAKGS